jgi:hypothetical protein
MTHITLECNQGLSEFRLWFLSLRVLSLEYVNYWDWELDMGLQASSPCKSVMFPITLEAIRV